MNPLRRGSTQIEYVLIAAVVSVGILTGVSSIGASLGETLMGIGGVLAGF
jgi:Flp pilus assembly pilin Flp